MIYKPSDAQGNDLRQNYLPCSVCNGMTLVTMLSEYGSRCRPCYDVYCVGKAIGPELRFLKPDPARLKRYLGKLAQGICEAQQSPRAWAYRLRDREEAGEKLTIAQREAWREVIGRTEA